MIRTRDLVLFVVTLLFLLILIIVTVPQKINQPIHTYPNFSAVEEDWVGEYDKDEFDRTSFIANLRAKLGSREVVATEPVVAEPEPDVVSSSTESMTNIVVVVRCSDTASESALALARGWPLSDVVLAEDVNARLVQQVVVTEQPAVGSSTQASYSTDVTTLARLPRFPVKASATTCLASDVVGVTETGALLFNSDAIAYYHLGANDLIGYARDGFPIYGTYDGETDVCGGYEVNGQYRYTLSTDRMFVLGCYNGTPINFVGE